tara:strand:- start:290 stop:1477 length:1188 start_codon:yes stop_codon:yes gene_type:complete
MSKNTHLEHLEDDILNNGSAGGKNAINFLNSLGKMLTGPSSSSINVTTKWDGAPAVVCGTNPENGEFFVGTKSVFNINNPKICYSDEQVDFYYDAGELNKKLKACLKYLPSLNLTGILQGDLLYTTDKTVGQVNGESCVVFQPNTITYAIPSTSPLGAKVKASSLGIVFHTKYTGATMSELTATFGVKTPASSATVHVFSSNFTDATGASQFTAAEKTAYNAAVNRASGSLKQASAFLDILKDTGQGKFMLAVMFKQFFNSYIRGGKNLTNTKAVTANFANYYQQALTKQINSVKTPSAKSKWQKVQADGLKFIKTYNRAIYMTVASYLNLIAAKNMVVKKLSKVQDIGTFIRTDDGYRVTAPEGFVAIKSGTSLKLVDRMEFSKSNFTVAKNWG